MATADCIEKVGLEGLTSRKIAAEAEVPLAAINYHFGSKANLVEQALLLTQQNSVKAIQQMLQNGDGTALARIEDFLHFVIASTQKFPTIARAHLEGPLWRGESKSEYMRAFCETLETFVSQLPPDELAINGPQLRQAIACAIGGAIAFGLSPDLFYPLTGDSVRDDAQYRKYAQTLMGVFQSE